ncbi:hypothetical protein DSO57_1033278 [Entomophthora muscae]|uniref:Uncharacterized protein n=1 Tax=Entomophthora muscae TaxID=34485 RepID=A0ACC2U9Z6_9FUNG|nr:hypothetical protein DSO57_1033278 [Entomophthora muscae]
MKLPPSSASRSIYPLPFYSHGAPQEPLVSILFFYSPVDVYEAHPETCTPEVVDIVANYTYAT